jgi:hypothetical protein
MNQQTQGEEVEGYEVQFPLFILESEHKAKLAEVLLEVEKMVESENYCDWNRPSQYVYTPDELETKFRKKTDEIRTRLGISNHSENE